MNAKISVLINLAIIFFTMIAASSCNNDLDVSPVFTSSGKVLNQEHLQKMKQLCVQYGWTKDEDASVKEYENFLLSSNFEKMKDFFELMKTGGITINLTDISQNPVSVMTGSRNFRATYVLRGQHSSYFSSSTTEMVVRYNREQLEVVSTAVSSNPACTWSPNPTSTFYFNNNRCNIVVTGKVKSGFIKRNMTMKAYLLLRPNSDVVAEGSITSFRE